MKTKMSFAVALAFAGTSLLFPSCSQSDKERAEDNMEDARDNTKEKADDMEAWMEFRREAKEEIAENRTKIARLKAKQAESGKVMDKVYQARIDQLEEKNNKLDQKIDEYKPENENWQEFKREFRHDMDELGNSIRDIGKDNEK